MAENLERHLAGLEIELEYAEARGGDNVAEIKKEIANTKKRLKKAGSEQVETAVEASKETPEKG